MQSPRVIHGAHLLVPSSACQTAPTVENIFGYNLEDVSFLITGNLQVIIIIILVPHSAQHIAIRSNNYTHRRSEEMFLKRVGLAVELQLC